MELCFLLLVFSVNVLLRTGPTCLPLETQKRDLSVENDLYRNPGGKSKTVSPSARTRSISSERFDFPFSIDRTPKECRRVWCHHEHLLRDAQIFLWTCGETHSSSSKPQNMVLLLPVDRTDGCSPCGALIPLLSFRWRTTESRNASNEKTISDSKSEDPNASPGPASKMLWDHEQCLSIYEFHFLHCQTELGVGESLRFLSISKTIGCHYSPPPATSKTHSLPTC